VAAKPRNIQIGERKPEMELPTICSRDVTLPTGISGSASIATRRISDAASLPGAVLIRRCIDHQLRSQICDSQKASLVAGTAAGG